MFDFSEVSLNQLVVHNIGNRAEEEGINFSNEEMRIHDHTVEDILKQYFLSKFKSDFFYCFTHESDLQLNEVYNHINQIFDEPSVFFEKSKDLAKYLYEQSNHPKIKTGEFYMARFSDVQVGDEVVDAIGLFKSENKDTYIRVYQKEDHFEVDYENGINIKKLDKGCLIFNTEREQGYKISIIDTASRSNEALYWRDSFLNVSPQANEYYKTNQLIDLCKGFSDQVLIEGNNVDKQEQVEFVKRTEDFFSNNETYNNDQFKQEVIGNEEISEAFEEYKHDFETQRDLSPVDQFEISQQAVKKGKKYFRSVIKLDKNFHIYVHANPDFIEKGFDNVKNLKFYKLYFHEEE